MPLSKKHYTRAADILGAAGTVAAADPGFTASDAVRSVAERFADWFGEDNPAFRRQQFLDAARPKFPSTDKQSWTPTNSSKR